jgi:hypothetical protein
MAATRSHHPEGDRQKWQGALAQLGERLHGMQEVSGSIPLGSTISSLYRRYSWLFYEKTAGFPEDLI